MQRNIFVHQSHAVIYQDYLWGFNASRNELLKTNLLTGEISYITSFEHMRYEKILFDHIVEYRGKLILIPGNSDYIVTYQIDTGEVRYYEYKESFSEYKPPKNFWKYSVVSVYSKWLYAFSGYKKYIMKIDLDTMEISYDFNAFDSISENSKLMLATSNCIEDNMVFIPCMNENLCIAYDMESGRFQWIKIELANRNDKGFRHMNSMDEYLILLSNNNKVLFINKEKYHVEKEISMEREYGRIGVHGKSILLVPYYRNNFMVINYKGDKDEFSYDKDMRYNPLFGNSVQTHTKIIQTGSKCYIIPRCSNMLIWFDFSLNKLVQVKMSMTDNYRAYLQKILENRFSDILLENFHEKTLDNLLEVIKYKKGKNLMSQKNQDQNVGKLIYERTCEFN